MVFCIKVHALQRKKANPSKDQTVIIIRSALKQTVSNLPKGEFPPLALVNIYKRRMTIEEAFRDTKNEYYGLGLKRSRSQSIERLQTLLLIALLAQWCLYVIGKAAEMQGYHRHFQSNTITTRRVLSYCYLAKRILKTSRYEITEKMLFEALDLLLLETKC
ncbi:transposase [Marinomonas arctica]|uniref:transposase n=1 Tax=Marinomonas arctica TaxID=383750 RepID=UPI00294FF5D1|nr:transposase [Marinomonas arctica]